MSAVHEDLDNAIGEVVDNIKNQENIPKGMNTKDGKESALNAVDEENAEEADEEEDG
jgi:hypothetical protein